MKLKPIVKNILPAPLLQRLKRIVGSSSDTRSPGQQEADYYNNIFENNDSWRLHYTCSPYYMIWTVIIDRLRRRDARKVLEIGCGPGQLASAIRDAGVVEAYSGFDFSSKGIELARAACPQFSFEVADVLKTDLIEKTEYDMVLTTEFLEHVEGDLDVIRKIHPGAILLATVPSFPYVSHVRHFNHAEEVMERYGSLFEDFSVVAIPANENGTTFFLLEGRKSGKK